jgi:hypothetical protein
MTANDNFSRFCESLAGSWIGRRRGLEHENEIVRSQWQKTLDGNFLRENWLTAGSGDTPEPTAEALFKIAASGPGDFVAVYKSGKIAFGESAFAGGEWRLTHRWLREPGVAAIRVKFLDADTYEQEVDEVMPDGTLKPESKAIMKREPVSKRIGDA